MSLWTIRSLATLVSQPQTSHHKHCYDSPVQPSFQILNHIQTNIRHVLNSHASLFYLGFVNRITHFTWIFVSQEPSNNKQNFSKLLDTKKASKYLLNINQKVLPFFVNKKVVKCFTNIFQNILHSNYYHWHPVPLVSLNTLRKYLSCSEFTCFFFSPWFSK